MPLAIECFQEAMRKAYYERDRERGLFKTFSWLVEEVGELAEALRSSDKERISEELADVIAWTISIANLLGINIVEALEGKYGGDIESAGCKG